MNERSEVWRAVIVVVKYSDGGRRAGGKTSGSQTHKQNPVY